MNPYTVKQETGILATFLDALPMDLDKDPHGDTAFSVAYAGAGATASVAQQQLAFTVSGGSGESFVVDLQGKTLSAVVTEINGHVGFTATLIASGTAPAVGLVPVQQQNLFSNSILTRFTSTLWTIIVPMVWALERSLTSITNGLQQMNLQTADGLWIDAWGELYGSILRLFNEADRAYAARILREVARWRLNEFSLQDTFKREYGVTVNISNLHDKAWVYGRTPYGKYVGRKYARTTMLIDPQEEIDPNFRVVVERNRAAGVLPFYVFRGQGGAPSGDRQWNGKGQFVSKVKLADVVYLKTLTAQAASGQAVLSLADVTNIAANKRITLINGVTTETGTVLSVNVGLQQVTLTANLTNTYPTTSQVLVYPYVEQSSLRWEVPVLVTKKKTEQVFVGGSVAFALGTSALGSTDILGGVPAGAIALSDSASASKG